MRRGRCSGVLRKEQKFDFLRKAIRASHKEPSEFAFAFFAKRHNQRIKSIFPRSFSLLFFFLVESEWELFSVIATIATPNLRELTYSYSFSRVLGEKGWTHLTHASISGKAVLPRVDPATPGLHSQPLE